LGEGAVEVPQELSLKKGLVHFGNRVLLAFQVLSLFIMIVWAGAIEENRSNAKGRKSKYALILMGVQI
jgi:hypothetical protein